MNDARDLVHSSGRRLAYAEAELELRASDDDRDRAAGVLGGALATGRLTSAEYADRLDVVYAAKTLGDLAPLTRDLPAEDGAGAGLEVAGRAQVAARFSKVIRSGRWVAGRHTRLTARFGALIVNLADAVLPGREITLEVDAFCGKLIVVVPAGAHVIDEGGALFAKRAVYGREEQGAADGPVIRIVGDARFSKVAIFRGRLVGDARSHGSLNVTDVDFDLLNLLDGLAWRVMRVKRVCAVVIGGLASAGLAAALIANSASAGVGALALRASDVAARGAAVPGVGNPAGHQPVPAAARAVNTSHPNHVIGRGTPAGCTSAAVVKAVAEGGIITFDCGPKPVTIKMTATAKVVNTSHRVVLDGGGKVTLSGGTKIRILYMNTCDPKQKYTTDDCWEQQWPQLVVQNLSFVNAYSGVQQTATSSYGGGAIFDQGGQLKVVNSAFVGDRCYKSGPDLGGGAVRALGMYMKVPVYINHDTFTNNSCSNGAALSGLYANFYVINSLMANNKAIGFGANPAGSGTAGGGSGGAIYTDGNSYNLTISGTSMSGNTAREGGGAIFYVVDGGPGTLRISYSWLHHNPSGEFQNKPGIFSEVDGKVVPPVVVHSVIN